MFDLTKCETHRRMWMWSFVICSILMNKIGKSSSKVCLHLLIELFQKHGKGGQETETAELSNNFYILRWHCQNLKWMHDSHICLEAMFFF